MWHFSGIFLFTSSFMGIRKKEIILTAEIGAQGVRLRTSYPPNRKQYRLTQITDLKSRLAILQITVP